MELVFHSNHPIKNYWKLHEENRNIKKVQVYAVCVMAPFLDDDKEQRERVSSNVLLAMDSLNR